MRSNRNTKRIPRLTRIREIQNEECSRAGITLAQMLGKSRQRWIAYPRMIAMARCTVETDASLIQIAYMFWRDHTTVIHARDKFRGELVSVPELQQIVLGAVEKFLEIGGQNENPTN